MKINITAGECLKEILEKIYPNLVFIPFNEAMIKGSYSSRLFSNEFLIERANVHNVTIDEYKRNMQGFLNIINNVNQYSEISLYFGGEEFCVCNRLVVLNALKEYGYKGKIISNIVDENNGNVLSSEVIVY